MNNSTRTSSSTTSTTWRRNNKKRLQRQGEKNEVKSVLFIPHTRDSGLASIIRERENKLFEVTGDKVKVVEKAGQKLEHILAGKDPWRGKDCRRPNCLLCSTKVRTGKELNKDCSKRNITYEIKCLTCETKMLEEIELEAGDDNEKRKELEKNLQVPKYIGESSRSAYERGFEHLDMLARLSSKSMMLKHILAVHENKDMSEIEWGMSITSYKRSAFDRQIDEAVRIDREFRNNKNILNSKSEWANSALPRLVARNGSIEEEMKKIESELNAEKKKEEEFETKVRNLRKMRNKARLQKESHPPSKRQKINEESYTSIRQTWGPPPPTAQKKNSLDTIEEDNVRKKIKLDEKTEPLSTDPTLGVATSPTVEDSYIKSTTDGVILTNNRRVEDRVILGLTMKDHEIEEEIDWEQHLSDYRLRLEKETLEREERIEKKTIKEKSWLLFRECKQYLENNEKDWEKKRIERELENKKIERLAKARYQQDQLRLKVREKQLRKEIDVRITQLPLKEKKRLETEENKKNMLELAEARKNLWKLRNKEKKYERRPKKLEELEKIDKKDNKKNENHRK